MLYYTRIGISKGINLAKSNNSKECIICHYQFFNHGFKFQDSVHNGCHDLTMLTANISNIALSLLKILIIVVLFIKLANLKQLIYLKIMFLKIVGVYKKILSQISVYSRQFFYIFCLVFIKWMIVWTYLFVPDQPQN